VEYSRIFGGKRGVSSLRRKEHGAFQHANMSSFGVRSLNIWHLPADISRDNEPRLSALVESAADLSREESDTAVVALQEVWTDVAQRRVADAFRGNDWHTLQGRGGLVLCTRYPQVAQYALTYQNRGHAERWDHGDYQAAVVGSSHPWGKGVVAALVETGSSGRVLVATTHLIANYEEPKPQPIDRPDRYAGVRAAQVVELALALQGWRRSLPPGTPVVLCGDLNMDRHERLFGALCDVTGLRPAAMRRMVTYGGALNTYSSRETPVHIDHVLHSPGLACDEDQPEAYRLCFTESVDVPGKGARSMSDHFGVAASLCMQPPSEQASQASRSYTQVNESKLWLGERIDWGIEQASHRVTAWQATAVGSAIVAGLHAHSAWRQWMRVRGKARARNARARLVHAVTLPITLLLSTGAISMGVYYVPGEVAALKEARRGLDALE